MLKIRFLRTGKKQQPFFKIVVTDKDSPPQGGEVKAEIGNYNPRSKKGQLDADAAKHWLQEGAQPSDRVHNLLVREGVIEGEKKAVHASEEVEQEEEEQQKTEQETDEKEEETEQEEEAEEETETEEEDEDEEEQEEEEPEENADEVKTEEGKQE